MKPEDKIRELIHKADLTTGPGTEERILGDARRFLETSSARQGAGIRPARWSALPRSALSRCAAAAVVLAAIGVLVMVFDRGTPPAYALEQTIQANHTIKTIHLRILTGEEGGEHPGSTDGWMKYDDAGRLTNSRRNLCEEDGVKFSVWNDGVLKTWIPENNVVIIIRVNNLNTEMEDFAEKYDPKLMLQRLYDDSKKNGSLTLDIDESGEEGDAIRVRAVNAADRTRVELLVDPATKLVKRFSRYRLGGGEDEPVLRIKFLAYNRPIDPAVFALNGIPDDALIIDRVDQLVGLKKGASTDREIAARVVRACLEATLAGDDEEASRLMEGDPGDTVRTFIKERFDARLARIVSIGKPEPHEKWKSMLCVPCEIEVENEKREKRIENITAMAKPIGYQPGSRWIMHTTLLVGESGAPSTGARLARVGREGNTIIPKVGVGEFTLDLDREAILKKLGKPKAICYRGERYTLENLPENYIMFFGDLSFGMNGDAISWITVHTPLFRFKNGLGVGDTDEKIKQAFGPGFRFEECEWKDFLNYENEGLEFEIHKKDRTVMEISIHRPPPDEPDEADAAAPSSLKPFDRVSGKDLRACDLRDTGDFLDTLEFNQETLWPAPDRLPEGFNPKALLQASMNPGLGVWALHAAGITGANVHVGLIDQPLRVDHPEYAGKIASYHCEDCGASKSSMHGPSMACQIVGRWCGTAPGARLHVVAVPSWKADAAYYARALDRFVAYNRTAPRDEKIRVVSVSSQPSGRGSQYENQSRWDQAVARAEAEGILVLDCTWHHGFVSLCWLDPRNREAVESCTPGFRNGEVEVDEGHIHVPTAPRTTVEAYEDKPFGYAYDGGGRRSSRPGSKGGYSDSIPYAAGILALGWQVRPELSPARMKELLFATAHVHESGARIIDPRAFIERLRE